MHQIIKEMCFTIAFLKDTYAFFTAGQAVPYRAGNLDMNRTARTHREQEGMGLRRSPALLLASPWCSPTLEQRQLTPESGLRGQIPLLWESRTPQINEKSSKLLK